MIPGSNNGNNDSNNNDDGGGNGNDSQRVINFGAGPSSLPLDVLTKIQNEMINWNNTHMSILEQSHRSPEFKSLLTHCKLKLIKLLNLPNDYSILFMPGGGTLQFSAIPLNLSIPNLPADYLVTGSWSRKAAIEASKFIPNLNVIELFSPSNGEYDPNWKFKLSKKSSFIYYCDNETIEGREFPFDLVHDALLSLSFTFANHVNDRGDNNNSSSNSSIDSDYTLVCDASSNFLSRTIRFDDSPSKVIFATAQKNFGSAGITIVIIKKDLITDQRRRRNTKEIEEIENNIPLMLDYQLFDKHDSIYNTPPVFAIYIVDLYLEWLERQFTNLNQINQFSQLKSSMIINFINEHSDQFFFFHLSTPNEWRSRMNIVFYTKNDNLLINMAKERGIIGIKGHGSIGGIRISLYNAIGMKQVNSCLDLLQDFIIKNDSF